MSKKSNYEVTESLAFWKAPCSIKEFNSIEDDSKKVKLFKKSNQNRAWKFNYNLIKNRNMDNVFVGKNPGQLGKEGKKLISKGKLLNFHGPIKSGDYRLASVLYGTKFWGSFMIDLCKKSEKSDLVHLTNLDVKNFFDRIKEIGINEKATIFVLGLDVYKAFAKYAGHKDSNKKHEQFLIDYNDKYKYTIKYVYHYSHRNGHWNWKDVHNQIISK